MPGTTGSIRAYDIPAEEDAGGGGFLSGLFGGGEETATEGKAPEKTAKAGCKTAKDGVKRCTVESAVPAGD